ncbi:MAG TPA: FCD domain-containing protein [Solirubrobacteraceae bacterium]
MSDQTPSVVRRPTPPQASGDGLPHPLGAWRAPKVSQRVAMAIVEDIISRDLSPGDRLPPEAEMMERFQISRASLREGLRLLETYGVITIRQGQRGGPEIGSLQPTDLARMLSLFYRLSGATYRDVLQARLLIEPVMTRLAAEHQPREQIKALHAVLDLEDDTPADEYVHVANNFHELVSGLSGNPVLDLLGHALRALYAEHVYARGLFPEETLASCRKAHPLISEAIFSRNGELAEKLMADHITEISRVVSRRAAWFMKERVAWEV